MPGEPWVESPQRTQGINSIIIFQLKTMQIQSERQFGREHVESFSDLQNMFYIWSEVYILQLFRDAKSNLISTNAKLAPHKLAPD